MVYEKRDLLWKINTNLQMICLMYNKMKTDLNKIELQLISEQIQNIDLKLESAVNGELTWNDHSEFLFWETPNFENNFWKILGVV